MKQQSIGLIIFLLLCLVNGALAQNLMLTNKLDGRQLTLKLKKIESIVTMDGEYFQGKPKWANGKLRFSERIVGIDQIGIIEVKKKGFRKTASLPFKWIGIATGAVGLMMVSTYLSEEEDPEPELGIAGLSLLGAGAGSVLISSQIEPGTSKSIQSFHAKDWSFHSEGR